MSSPKRMSYAMKFQIAASVAMGAVFVAALQDDDKNTASVTPGTDYIIFKNLEVEKALAHKRLFVSGGAFCPTTRSVDDCLKNVGSNISYELRNAPDAVLTDVIPNPNLRTGKTRTYTELKNLVRNDRQNGIADDHIPVYYTIAKFTEAAEGSVVLTRNVERARCPNAISGGCPSGPEF